MLRVGTCDTAIGTSLSSRLISGVFYFDEITISEISADCNAKKISIFFLDSSSVEIAKALDGTVSGTTYTVDYTSFTDTTVLSSDIAYVAIEITD
jgi:hypothetical protein